MTEMRIDPVTALMPPAARPVPPAIAFASYLDQVWSFTATAAPMAGTRNELDSGSGYATVAPESPRAVAAPAQPARDDNKGKRSDTRLNEALAQSHASAGNSDAAPAGSVSEEVASPYGSNQQEQPAGGTTGNADAAEDAESAPAPDAEGGQPVAEDAESAGTEHDSVQAACEVDVLPGHTADRNARDANISSEGMAGVSSPSQAEQEAVAEGGASGGASSSDGESGAEGRESLPSREVMDDGGDKSERADGTRKATEPHESGSRRGKPATAREAASTRLTQSADSRQAPAPDSPLQAAASSAIASQGQASFAAPLTAAAVSMETSHPTTSSAPVVQGEGATLGNARMGSAETVSRTGSAAPNAEGDQADAVGRVRFVQRVARAFQAAGDRGGTVRLRLSPPELGSLRVEITVSRGVMNARLEAETQTARQLLLDNLPMLRERLAEQDIKVEHFQVDISDRQPGGLPDRSDHRSQPDRTATGAERRPGGREDGSEESDTAGRRRPRHIGQPSQLDVLV